MRVLTGALRHLRVLLSVHYIRWTLSYPYKPHQSGQPGRILSACLIDDKNGMGALSHFGANQFQTFQHRMGVCPGLTRVSSSLDCAIYAGAQRLSGLSFLLGAYSSSLR